MLLSWTILITSFIAVYCQAYPTAIGYGYANCMTCHYQPHGNGQLNDYGRALYASEIASKPFWDFKKSNEELANQSSFTMQKPEPAKFKPSIRYREININTSPGGTNAFRKYIMQGDIGFAYHFDSEDKYIFVGSVGYIASPINSDIPRDSIGYNMTSREHYLRIQTAEDRFWSLGLFDITYGLKIADHTASNRKGINQDMNNQAYGILYNVFTEKWLTGYHLFFGNQLRNEVDRFLGLSTSFEYMIKDNLTAGGSFLAGGTIALKQYLMAFHSRIGVGKGSSLLVEIGFNHVEPATSSVLSGFYALMNGTLRVFRGLDFETTLELVKRNMDATSDESYRSTFGFIYYPFQRTELRLNAVNSRTFSNIQTKGDTWALQSQFALFF